MKVVRNSSVELWRQGGLDTQGVAGDGAEQWYHGCELVTCKARLRTSSRL
jgi:hypothetical protein